MFRNKGAITQFFYVAVSDLVLTVILILVYLLFGALTKRVVLGALTGCTLTILNFLFISISATRVADSVQEGKSSSKAALAMQITSTIRRVALAIIYIIILRADVCEPIPAILPLVFTHLSISMMEFFRKEVDSGK